MAPPTSMFSRRRFMLTAAAATAAGGGVFSRSAHASTAIADLKSLTTSATPIGRAEHLARLAKVQGLLVEQRIGALLIEAGSSLKYFTGIDWWRSERSTVALIPAHGDLVVITPAFEEPSVRQTLAVPGDVRPWNEDQNPFALIVQALKSQNFERGTLAVESTTRYFIIDGIQRVSSAYRPMNADAIVRACRLIKTPAELALMQIANRVTLEALRFVHGHLTSGMTTADVETVMSQATRALGAEPEFSLALLNDASAYPHGSITPQTVRDGSTILMDCGCTVHGYQSDVSRTWVFGTPSAKQRKVWDTVKRGQEIALETAKLGVPVGRIDDTVRAFYVSEGWGPGYRLPGLPHRTGHGIGLDGHEPAYLVHGDATPLAAGMCFSDEPGIYIPGEFGVRLEDCWHMTESGPQTFTPLARSLDEPV